MQITVRTAKPAELLEIQKMHKAGIFGDSFDSCEILENKKGFVALAEKKIVGFCSVGERLKKTTGKTKKEGVLVRVEIAKAFQGKGIGHKLAGKASSFFESRGVRAVRLRTLMEKAKFFEKAGFRILAEKKPHAEMLRITKKPFKKPMG